ncbi:WxL domain-containing protein [Vagococcus sp.]|uniref:WxL domain-containing protein n=1 Tax=Vagococcus sp. TaxID=1933889 RepID=UPI003F96A8A2
MKKNNKQLFVRKILFFILTSSLLVVSFSSRAFAALSDTSTTNFELLKNDNGLELEASNVVFDQKAIEKMPANGATLAKTKMSVPIELKINDFSGKGTGWNLSVKLDKLLEGQKELKGAKIIIPATTATPVSSFEASIIASIKPDVSAINLIAGTTGMTTLAKADVGKGYGEWKINYNNSDATAWQLEYLYGNLADNYTANLTYQLKDGPTL